MILRGICHFWDKDHWVAVCSNPSTQRHFTYKIVNIALQGYKIIDLQSEISALRCIFLWMISDYCTLGLTGLVSLHIVFGLVTLVISINHVSRVFMCEKEGGWNRSLSRSSVHGRECPGWRACHTDNAQEGDLLRSRDTRSLFYKIGSPREPHCGS